MLTQKDIDEAPWIGDQRAQIQELLDRAEAAEAKIDRMAVALITDRFVDRISEFCFALSCEDRVKLAQKLVEGTSATVIE